MQHPASSLFLCYQLTKNSLTTTLLAMKAILQVEQLELHLISTTRLFYNVMISCFRICRQ